MRTIDPAEAGVRLRRHPERHVAELCNLDDRYWPQATVYHGHDQALMLYGGLGFPFVLAIADPPEQDLARLVADCIPFLPDGFYGHLSSEAGTALAHDFDIAETQELCYMAARDVVSMDADRVVEVTEEHSAEVTKLLEIAFPDHHFVPELLSNGPFRGVRVAGELIAVAGTYAWSPACRVALIGHIATHPAHRRQGLASLVTVAVCRELFDTVELVGLVVEADNTAAISCYEALGFTVSARVLGAACTRRPERSVRRKEPAWIIGLMTTWQPNGGTSTRI